MHRTLTVVSSSNPTNGLGNLARSGTSRAKKMMFPNTLRGALSLDHSSPLTEEVHIREPWDWTDISAQNPLDLPSDSEGIVSFSPRKLENSAKSTSSPSEEIILPPASPSLSAQAPVARKTRKRGRSASSSTSTTTASTSKLLPPLPTNPRSSEDEDAESSDNLDPSSLSPPVPSTPPPKDVDPATATASPRTGRLMGRRKAAAKDSESKAPSAPKTTRAKSSPAPAPSAAAAAEEVRGTGEPSSASSSAPAPSGRPTMRERARKRYSRYLQHHEDVAATGASPASDPSGGPSLREGAAGDEDGEGFRNRGRGSSKAKGFSMSLDELQGQVAVLAEIARKLGWEGLKFNPSGSLEDATGGQAPKLRPALTAQRTPIDDSAVSMFMYDMGHVPVLEKAEEGTLTKIMYQHQNVDRAFTAIDESNVGSVDAIVPENMWPDLLETAGCASAQEAKLRRKIYRDARALMVHYNLRLVISVANKYRNKGLDFEDLIPEGIQGLSRALDKFDPSRGFKFSTYAHWWIRQALTRAITEHSRVVRLPVHVSDAVSKYKRVSAQLRARLGRAPHNREVAHVMGLPVERLEIYLKAARPHRSLEQTIMSNRKSRGTDEKATDLNEMLMAEEEDPVLSFGISDPDDILREQAIKDELNRVLEGLEKRERNILKLRYGMTTLTDHQAMTFTDIGNMHGLTKERIRQIELKALSKLRKKETRSDLESVLYDYKWRFNESDLP